MTIVFISNYYNHHQSEICKEFDVQTGHQFCFIETEPMESERLKMGWGQEEKPQYVMQSYRDAQAYADAMRRVEEADVVIWGSCPFEMIRPRLKQRKLTYAYSERLFKSGNFAGKVLRGVKYFLRLKPYQKNHYLLCASAYAAKDYNQIGLFRNAAFPWGYFPAIRHYEDVDALMDAKEKNSILWVARMIPLKHPEHVVEVAKRLKLEGYEFQLKMVGDGVLAEEIRQSIRKEDLEDRVCMPGAMLPEEVRTCMEQSAIFLFTSDQHEGWGAVVNESMNSACAVVACNAIGSVPFLIENGETGLTYENGNVDELYEKVKWLLDHQEEAKRLGENAYRAMEEKWNAKMMVAGFLKMQQQEECE